MAREQDMKQTRKKHGAAFKAVQQPVAPRDIDEFSTRIVQSIGNSLQSRVRIIAQQTSAPLQVIGLYALLT
jgi:hypothetical protein